MTLLHSPLHTPSPLDRPATGNAASALSVYGTLSRVEKLGYRGKIMLVAFIGIHVPLLVLVGWALSASALNWQQNLPILLVTLLATLVGTGLTLWVLHHLLRPIVATSDALRRYLQVRALPELPTQFSDEVGTLMNDASFTLYKLDATIRALAYLDQETGLLNRIHFRSEITHALGNSDNRPFSVCTLAIHNICELTSLYGSTEATSYLRAAGRALEQELDYHGKLARISDSAFGFILESVDPGVLQVRLTLIIERLEATRAHISSSRFQCGVGVARYPADGNSAASLLENAELAQSESEAEPGKFTLYSGTSRSQIRYRYQLERELRLAVEGGELCLHYQPVIDASRQRIIGAEALIRWNHPERGLQMPDMFIPLAERCELIQSIGRWTLQEACSQLKQWRVEGLDPGRIAVNLSARQFNDPTLLLQISEALSSHQVSASKLGLELTETSAMQDIARTRAVLSSVRALGMSVAIDDFGTGYSSMSYLRTLPFDSLKIDRDFVQSVASQPERKAICAALVALAEGLGLSVVAEGVEDEADREAMQTLGCNCFQGFLYSRAVPAMEFGALLAADWPPVEAKA